MWRWSVFLLCLQICAQELPLFEEGLWKEPAHEEESLSVLEYFELYRREPLCLPRATVRELSRLPGISVGIARQLLRYLQRYPHLTYAELGDSVGLTPEQLWVLQQATRLECSPPPGERGNLRSVTMLPLVPVVGKENLAGAFFRTQGWARVRWGWLYLGAAWDKDAGEPGVVDFFSGALQAEPFPGVRCLLGDYCVSLATGALLGGRGAFWGRSFSLGSFLRWETEITPWWSVWEDGFLRGGAVRWEWRVGAVQGVCLGWLSSTLRSGRIDTLGVVRSVVTDGIFATAQQRSLRCTFRERTDGVVTEVAWGGVRTAIGVLGVRYSHPLQTESRRQFLGRSGYLVSLALGWECAGGEGVGEVLRDARGYVGGQIALRYRRGNYHAVVALQYFPDSLRSPYGSAWGALVSNRCEVVVGIGWRTHGQHLQLYGDLFRAVAAVSPEPAPPYGSELGVRWGGAIGRGAQLWLQSRYRTWLESIPAEAGRRLVEKRLLSVRADVALQVLRRLRWRLRTEWKRELGLEPLAAYLALSGAEAGGRRWSASGWLGIYAVPSSALGVWVYEKVATGVPHLVFLVGYGSYAALWGQWQVSSRLRCEAAFRFLSRAYPAPLQLWGMPVSGRELRVASFAVEVLL